MLVATRVKVDQQDQGGDNEFEVDGRIISLDTVAKTFVVRDVTVSYAGAVEFSDGTAADLAVGRNVEVRGKLTAEGTRLQAERIKFDD